MLDRRPPLRIIAPGRCYRNDTIDATHSPIFHQIEGLYVDEGVSFADLKYTLTYFARALYGADVNVRFPPCFFRSPSPAPNTTSAVRSAG
jgi:phenylalanyl-tRNA synthetase alpha chain